MNFEERSLFDPGPAVVKPTLSRDQRRTLKNRALLERGIHPATGAPLRVRDTCGNCKHHEVWRFAGRYHKCALTATNSAATDIRVGWPACTLWEPIPKG